MKIRLAQKKDLESILPLFKELDAKHYKNNSDVKKNINEERYNILFANFFKENSNLILTVAEDNDCVIGFALSKITTIQNNLILKDALIGEVLYVAVASDYKRSGIGKKIMLDMEERLRDKNITKFELRVFSFNDETLPEKINYKAKYTVYEKYL